MAGDVVEPALLNVKRYHTITRKREEADMEMEWHIIVHARAGLILQKSRAREVGYYIALVPIRSPLSWF